MDRCVKCGGEMVMADRVSTSQGALAYVNRYDEQGKKTGQAPVVIGQLFVCKDCGYIEMYADENTRNML